VEEWSKNLLPKFEAAEKQLALNCEKEDDNGELFEVGYKFMIEVSNKDFKKRV